jgi:signal transduction histidine kinase
MASGATVLMDREHLHQALDCVLLNAVQAVEECESGTGSVHIETRRTPSRVEIRVTDTGSGILEENRGHVFEPLFSTKPNGIGLGLPLAKAILEEHWGGIDVEPGGEHGVTVILWMPIPA